MVLSVQLTSLGIQHQPEITPLIFARYARESRIFSAQPEMLPAAKALASCLDDLLGPEAASRAVWMGRMGYGANSEARSLRLPLDKLYVLPKRARNIEFEHSPRGE